MTLHFIAFAIPVIFLIIALEYYFSRKQKKNYFVFESSISNISIGIAERLAQLFLTAYFILVFQYVYDHFSIFQIPATLWSWLLIFIFTDFIWYWYHRLSHEINLLWGAHIVHHQSEEYNLTVSLRITIFQAFVRLIFGLILPLLGFPVYMSLIAISVLGIYQFFIHTQLIHKLGWLEYIFVTPSHHRAHHGSNDIYLDKNYGGILIIWDRLFGTFQEETEEVKYGLTKSVESNSFLWLHFHFWLDLWEHVNEAKGFKNKMKLVFSGPNVLTYRFRTKLRLKYLSKSVNDAHVSKKNNPRLYLYIYIQLIASLLTLFFLYLLDNSPLINFMASAFILLSVINCGAILEQKSWVLVVEMIRTIVILAFLIFLFNQLFLLAYLGPLILLFVDDYRFFKFHYFKRFYKMK